MARRQVQGAIASVAREYDVAIIGGGITGCATAYDLARGGARTVVLERGELAALASGANSGSLHAQIPYEPFATKGAAWAEAFAPVTAFLAASVARWQELGGEIGVDLEVTVGGGLLVAATRDEMRAVERKARLEQAAGLAIEIWSAADLANHAPYLAPGHVGGAFCPQEGKANPLIAGFALAVATRRAGAVVRRASEVTAIARQDGGWRLTLGGGETVRCDLVVNAAGNDAPRFAAMAGAPFAAEGQAIQASVTERTAQALPHLVYATREKLTLKQTAAGSFIIGGGWPAAPGVGGRLPQVDPHNLRQNLEVACATMPAMARLRIVRSWAAVVNGTDDWLPVIGEAPGAAGFYNAFFPWMGFTAAPLVALTVAEAILAGSGSSARAEQAGALVAR